MTASEEARGQIVAVDGSVRKNGRRYHIGMAYLDNIGDWWLDHYMYPAGFNPGTRVLQAELKAVKRAVTRHAHNIEVLCDSQAAVRYVSAWRRGEMVDVPGYYWDGLLNFRKLAMAFPERFTITWTPGHVGHSLNEGADALARLASRACIDGLSREDIRNRAAGIASSFAAEFAKLGGAA